MGITANEAAIMQAVGEAIASMQEHRIHQLHICSWCGSPSHDRFCSVTCFHEYIHQTTIPNDRPTAYFEVTR